SALPVPGGVRPPGQQPELPPTGTQHDGPAGAGAAERGRRDRGGEGIGRTRAGAGAVGGRARDPGVSANAWSRPGGVGTAAGAGVFAAVAVARAVPGAVELERVRVPGLIV